MTCGQFHTSQGFRFLIAGSRVGMRHARHLRTTRQPQPTKWVKWLVLAPQYGSRYIQRQLRCTRSHDTSESELQLRLLDQKVTAFRHSKRVKHATAMATQQDLQELLRLLTSARKLPMMQAMAQVKALQGVNLRRCVCLCPKLFRC